MSIITVEQHVVVDVEVDLDDIADKDLIEHLEANGYQVIGKDQSYTPYQEMFRALSLGDNDRALSLLRDHLCDCLGRVI